jgi:uncharacterized membrane protein YhaH (DUF805 family)
MFKAYGKYWRKFNQWQGYSSRSDFWWVFLINSIIFAILSVFKLAVQLPEITSVIAVAKKTNNTETIRKASASILQHPTTGMLVVEIVTAVIGLAILWPNMTLMARRLRDARFPWWLAIIYGVAALHGIVSIFLGATGIALTLLAVVLGIFTLVMLIFCMIAARYGDDEDDDSHDYN